MAKQTSVRQKAQQMSNNNKKNKKKKGGLKEYFKGVRLEMKKVTWPTKKELGSYTLTVLGTCAFFAVGFWLIDSGLLLLLNKVLSLNISM